jgi:hypothetical protein
MFLDGWMGGWVDGSKSGFKDCLQQSKITSNYCLFLREKLIPIKVFFYNV